MSIWGDFQGRAGPPYRNPPSGRLWKNYGRFPKSGAGGVCPPMAGTNYQTVIMPVLIGFLSGWEPGNALGEGMRPCGDWRGAKSGKCLSLLAIGGLGDFGAGVRAFVYFAEVGGTDVGVYLGRNQAFVPQQLLNAPDICAAVEQVSGKAMTQRVGAGAKV